MPQFYDLCLKETSEEIESLAEELDWDQTNCNVDTVFLEANDWGELKRKIRENREEADVLVFEGGDENLNRKAVSDDRMDILLHPEKGRKDSGVNHVIAREAAENDVAIGFDFQMLDCSEKHRSHIIRHWSRNLMLCSKYGTDFIITTSAEDKWDLRAPRDLANLLNSLDNSVNGKKAVSENPEKIIGRGEQQ